MELKDIINSYLSSQFEPLYIENMKRNRSTQIRRDGKLRYLNNLTKTDLRKMAFGGIVMAEKEEMYEHANSIRTRFKEEALKWYKNNDKIEKVDTSSEELRMFIIAADVIRFRYFYIKQLEWLTKEYARSAK